MLSRIKAVIKRRIESNFVRLGEYRYPFGLETCPKVYMKSFGTANPDLSFYVIWRDRFGSGFFSNLQHVLAHLKRAELLGMIPVVDFANFKTLYNEREPVSGTENAWEYYFEPVTGHELGEVYSSKNVFFCDGQFSWSMGAYLSDSTFYEIYGKYVTPHERIMKKAEAFWESIGEPKEALGVHFRGKEQNYASGHPFCPTKGQIYRCIDRILAKYPIDTIFLVTEDQRYLDSLRKRYGKLIFATGSFRSRKGNAYNMHPRAKHRYLLGEEVLIDSLLLAKCRGLLHGSSNVSEFARFINHGAYSFRYYIDNGVNSGNPLIARYQYALRKRLPASLGGLKNRIEAYGELGI